MSPSPLAAYVRMPTTTKERQLLRLAGMVHVTGLRPKRGQDYGDPIGKETRVVELACCSTNNGTFALVTDGGEIWIGREETAQTPEDVVASRKQLVQELNLSSRGCFVPCSNGEWLDHSSFLQRLMDPDWVGNPVAKI